MAGTYQARLAGSTLPFCCSTPDWTVIIYRPRMTESYCLRIARPLRYLLRSLVGPLATLLNNLDIQFSGGPSEGKTFR
jgi:hypothetical protein